MFSWETPPAVSGGRAAHVDGLAHALADAGHEVVVITRLTPGTSKFTESGSFRTLRVEIDLPWLPDRAIARVASANHTFVMAAADLGAIGEPTLFTPMTGRCRGPHRWPPTNMAARSSPPSTAPNAVAMGVMCLLAYPQMSTASNGGKRSHHDALSPSRKFSVGRSQQILNSIPQRYAACLVASIKPGGRLPQLMLMSNPTPT